MLIIIKKHLSFIGALSFVFIIYIGTRPLGTHDSVWVIPTGLSILNEFNMNLDEYTSHGLSESYAAVLVKGHYYNFFPYGLTFLVLPMIGLLKPILSENAFFLYQRHTEKFFATVLVVLALVFLYRLFCFYLSRNKASFLILFIGLGTSFFTTASRALWQHSGSVLLLSVSLYLLLYSFKKNERMVPLIALVLVFAYAVRPTNLIPLLIISVFVFFHFSAQRWKYVGVLIVAFLSFFLFNDFVFGDYLPPYYNSSRLVLDVNLFGKAIVGNLLSPNRGLLIWSPFFLFSFFAVFSEPKEQPFVLISCSVIFFHLMTISAFPHWWGGHSVGPRFMTDVVPFFAILICLSVKRFYKYSFFKYCFLFFVLLSFLIQFSAALSKKTQLWNIRELDINIAPERVWDWNKPQFYPFD
ncbi:hypothetical protein EHR01_05595 [Leptospira mtsangambouensis]|uniref:Dolichyl-phosphate-mannose--protein mannosyltransferase n=1 Tax=Leptospira mtsangambouensis TaxID=2484912 RepID=A0ABY2P459_9LEPT|nr:hypothetical protein [Leptospira mtsangambouensis]TGM82255.1 hypothetical protein EHR01_05595 [Leptospira mtsangambouensis]